MCWDSGAGAAVRVQQERAADRATDPGGATQEDKLLKIGAAMEDAMGFAGRTATVK